MTLVKVVEIRCDNCGDALLTSASIVAKARQQAEDSHWTVVDGQDLCRNCRKILGV